MVECQVEIFVEEKQLTDFNNPFNNTSDCVDDPLAQKSDINLENETQKERKRRLSRMRKQRWMLRQSEDVLHRIRVENRQRNMMRRLTETDEERALRLKHEARRRANQTISKEKIIERRRKNAERQRKRRAKQVNENIKRYKDEKKLGIGKNKTLVTGQPTETYQEPLDNIPVFVIRKN